MNTEVEMLSDEKKLAFEALASRLEAIAPLFFNIKDLSPWLFESNAKVLSGLVSSTSFPAKSSRSSGCDGVRANLKAAMLLRGPRRHRDERSWSHYYWKQEATSTTCS